MRPAPRDVGVGGGDRGAQDGDGAWGPPRDRDQRTVDLGELPHQGRLGGEHRVSGIVGGAAHPVLVAAGGADAGGTRRLAFPRQRLDGGRHALRTVSGSAAANGFPSGLSTAASSVLVSTSIPATGGFD